MRIVFLVLAVVSVGAAHGERVEYSVLRYQRTSKPEIMEPNNHDLRVTKQGSVLHQEDGKKTRLVTRLSSETMDGINELIRLSVPVEKGFQHPVTRCPGKSSYTDTYTAKNGSIFLKQGAECDNGWEINNRAAAKGLARILDLLENIAHQPGNLAEFQRQIDQIIRNSADDSDPSLSLAEAKTADGRAVNLFMSIQAAGDHKEILELTKKFTDAGYIRRGPTKAASLGGACGTKGCNSDFLVTTVFSTRAPNARSVVLAAIVEAGSGTFEPSLKRVIRQEEITQLISGNE